MGGPRCPSAQSIVGAVFGVFGVIAVVVFATSLNRLVTTPRRYGWTWDFAATDTISASNTCSHDDFGLGSIHGVGAIGVACYGTDNIQLNGHSVNGWSFTSLRGTIEPTVVAGRAPATPTRSRSGPRRCTPWTGTSARRFEQPGRTAAGSTGSSVRSCSRP